MCRQNTKQAGFTLIEIMIAVAILSLVASFAIPAYQQWMARYELKQFTSDVASRLSLGKMAAKNRNVAMTATFTKAVDGKVSIGFGDNTISPAVPLPTTITGGSLVQVTNVGPPPVEVITDFTVSPSGTLGTIQFTPQGLRVGGGVGNQRVTFMNNQGMVYSIAVTPGGKVNWCTKSTCP